MAENRFNSLTLWNLQPYTFLIKPRNFPEASPWTDREMKEWQTLFHAIIRMAKERAIDTYIVPFNIFVTPAFAKAHNVAMELRTTYQRESMMRSMRRRPRLRPETSQGSFILKDLNKIGGNSQVQRSIGNHRHGKG